MRRQATGGPSRAFGLALASFLANGCALVLDYGDFEDAPGTTSTGVAGQGGTGGAGAASGGGGTATTGSSTGGAGGSSTGSSSSHSTGGEGGCSPTAEIPLNDVDEDCDGSAAGEPEWHARLGDFEDQVLSQAAVGPTGDIVLAGHYEGTIDIGGGKSVSASAGARDLFVAKLAPDGAPLWIVDGGGAATPRECAAIAVDGGGDVLVAGHFADGAQGGAPRGFVAQLGPDGDESWSGEIDGTGESRALAVAAAPTGGVVAAGSFRGTIDFTSASHVSTGSPAKEDVFVVKRSAAGDDAWSQSFGGDGDDVARAVAVSAAGEVFVAGEYRGTPPGLPDAGDGAIPAFSAPMVLKLAAEGAIAWKKGFPATTLTTGGSRVLSIALDAEGAAWVTGAMYGDLKMGPGESLSYAGGADVFVARVEPSLGEVTFARSFGDGADQVGTSIAVDQDGNVFLAGVFSGTIDADPEAPGGGLTSESGQDLFLIKLDALGHHLWSARFAPAEAPGPRNASVAARGDGALLAGTWMGALDFGTAGMSQPRGGLDVFAVKLSR